MCLVRHFISHRRAKTNLSDTQRVPVDNKRGILRQGIGSGESLVIVGLERSPRGRLRSVVSRLVNFLAAFRPILVEPLSQTTILPPRLSGHDVRPLTVSRQGRNRYEARLVRIEKRSRGSS